VRFKFKGNVADKSIKTLSVPALAGTITKCANLNVHRCKRRDLKGTFGYFNYIKGGILRVCKAKTFGSLN